MLGAAFISTLWAVCQLGFVLTNYFSFYGLGSKFGLEYIHRQTTKVKNDSL